MLVVDDRVVADRQAGAGIQRAGRSECNNRRVLALRPLLDDIAGDRVHTAVRQVDRIRCRGRRAIHDTVVGDVVDQGTALNLVPGVRGGNVGSADTEFADRANIDIVVQPAGGAVIGEFRIGDGDRTAGIAICQQPVLIVVEVAVVDRQVAGLVAHPRRVAAFRRADRGTREFQIVERHRRTGGRRADDQDTLLVGRRLGRHQVDHATHTLDGDAGGDGREIIRVGSGLHLDDVAVVRGGNGGGQGCIFLARPNGQCSHDEGLSLLKRRYILRDRPVRPHQQGSLLSLIRSDCSPCNM